MLPGVAPKPVHKIEIGAQRRKGIHAGASNESEQHRNFWQDIFHPRSEAEFGISTVEEHKRIQDLCLVLCRASGVGVVLGETIHNGIQIE
ncbi:hypothetical protein D3Z53_20035 [Lachnospiraceae bacterium]|nr:hypothetical protein [Lachnospiraceae bacterium]